MPFNKFIYVLSFCILARFPFIKQLQNKEVLNAYKYVHMQLMVCLYRSKDIFMGGVLLF